MTHAFFLCNIIGSGTFQDPFRAEISDEHTHHETHAFDTDEFGKPINNKVLVRVPIDEAPLMADAVRIDSDDPRIPQEWLEQ